MRRSLLLVMALMALPATAAADLAVRGRQVTVQLADGRARALRSMASQLARLGIQGYATLYKTARQIIGSPKTDGAMLFATVNSPQLDGWFNTVGKQSIGFATRCLPDKGELGACLRVGNDWFHYEAMRGTKDWISEKVTTRFADGGKDAAQVKSAVEATFMVSPEELSAVRAFTLSRHLQLIKHTASTTKQPGQVGQPIYPVWKKLGASGNFNNESCAQACTSFFDEPWLKAFGENLPAIRAYGAQKGIPELASASAQTLQVLRSLRDRTGLGRPSGYKEIVKSAAPKADAVTVFNMIQAEQRVPGRRAEYMADPLQDLRWTVPGWANGLQSKDTPRCTTLLDRAPSQAPLRQTVTERLSLSSFLRE
jgi:hypothetical protein